METLIQSIDRQTFEMKKFFQPIYTEYIRSPHFLAVIAKLVLDMKGDSKCYNDSEYGECD